MVRKLIVKSFGLGLLGSAALLAGCASSSSSGESGVLTRDMQNSLTPAESLAELKAGNERFVRGDLMKRDWLKQAQATAGGQFPKAFVLGCVDSRVPVEIVFDKDIGDVFVGRVAGNFENVDLLGSMEFATAVAGSNVIVVLGHSECGAVKGAIDDVKLGNLTSLLSEIQPAVSDAARRGVRGTSKDPAFVQAAVEANVLRTVNDITARSPVLAERVANGDLLVVGAVYDLRTGRVTWLDG